MKHSSKTRGRRSDAPSNDEKKTILISSPDLNLCFSLSSLFQDRYNVVTTTTVGLLETFVEHYSANLIIVDCLPSEETLAQLDDLKRHNRDLPIIMLYVYNPKANNFEAGVRDIVNSVFYKPLDVTSLSRRIDDLLSV